MVLSVIGKSGSGKSFFCEYLSGKGFVVIDGDKVSREITVKDSIVYDEIRKAFGEEYFINGELDRRKLGRLVFSDKKELLRLEAITNAHINKHILNMINKNNDKNVVIDAFNVSEEIRGMSNYIIYIEANENDRINRIMKRDGLSLKEAEDRLAAQGDIKYRADFTIINDGSDFLLKAEKIYEEIMGRV